MLRRGFVDSNLLKLGRGELLFSDNAIFGTAIADENFRYLGSAPSLSIASSVERLDHFSSRSGVREKDRTVVVSRTFGPASFTLDEWDFENISMAFGATYSFMGNQVPATGTVQIGQFVGGVSRAYRLYTTAGVRYYDLQSINAADITISVAGIAATVNYASIEQLTGSWAADSILGRAECAIDAKMGIVYIPGWFGNGSGVLPGPGAIVAATINNANVGTGSVPMISDLSAFKRVVTGKLLFVVHDPASESGDAEEEWYFHNVELNLSGDVNLMSEAEWDQIPMTAELSQDSTGRLLTIRSHTNAD